MGGGSPNHELLSVEEAADVWGVSRGTVYYWIRKGILTCFAARGVGEGDTTAPRGEVFRAKVLSKRQVRARGISPALLERAIRHGVVQPSHDRFSLVDLEVIGKWTGAVSAPSALATVGVRRQSGLVRKSIAWTAADEIAWVERGADPAELPDGYFELPRSPRFIPPTGVWKYTLVDATVPDWPGARYVRRSAGYERRDGQLIWCEENDRFDVLGETESMKRGWTDSNRDYRIAEERWKRAWAQYWWRQGQGEGGR
jgi:hypothetical protein